MNHFAAMVCLCLVWAGPAFAQTPPAPPPVAKPAPPAPPRDIVDARADLNFVNASGNSRTQTIGGVGDVWVRPDGLGFRNRVAFVRSEARGVLTARQLNYLSRVEHPAGRAFLFAQYDLLLDRLAGVSSRHSATVGVQFKLAGDAKGVRTLMVFGGVGAARERRITSSGAAVAKIDTSVLNTGWSYVRKFANGSEFRDDFRTDAALDRADDWRVAHTATLAAAVNARVSLKLSHVLRHVNRPPSSFKKTDTVASAGIALRF